MICLGHFRVRSDLCKQCYDKDFCYQLTEHFKHEDEQFEAEKREHFKWLHGCYPEDQPIAYALP